jgi:hypothetical protein
VAVTSASAQAQSWLPAKGEGTVSVLFSNALSTDHYLPNVAYDFGHIDSNTLLFDVTYGLTDRVAVTVGLPVVTSRYRGNFPHRPITLDDGNWHTTAQDFSFRVRYNAFRGPVTITPFVGTGLPANDYEFYAHAAPGRQLKEVVTGVSVGRLFAELGLVLQGSYGMNFSQEALDVDRRFSTASLEAAYFITPAVRVMATTAGRIGHTGINLFPNSGVVLPPEVFQRHDQISRESFFNVGAGFAVSLNDSTDVYAAYTTTVTGRNTHATNRGLSLGMSWSFSRSGGDESLVARDSRKGSLVRCLCEKGGV